MAMAVPTAVTPPRCLLSLISSTSSRCFTRFSFTNSLPSRSSNSLSRRSSSRLLCSSLASSTFNDSYTDDAGGGGVVTAAMATDAIAVASDAVASASAGAGGAGVGSVPKFGVVNDDGVDALDECTISAPLVGTSSDIVVVVVAIGIAVVADVGLPVSL